MIGRIIFCRWPSRFKGERLERCAQRIDRFGSWGNV